MIVEERAFSVAEAQVAKEAFITSASTFVTPVIKINDRLIGTGQVGDISKRLRQRYIEFAISTQI